jgi:CrcB protein
MNRLLMLAWISAGGVCGTILRYSITILLEQNKVTNFPIGTFIINITGCLIFGFVSELASGSTIIKPEIKLALTTGFAGAFTTFSTFIFENYQLSKDSQFVLALVYTSFSVIGGAITLYLGIILARLIIK